MKSIFKNVAITTTVIFSSLNLTATNRETLTCEWNPNLSGCTDKGRMASIKVKITDDEFSYVMKEQFCHQQIFHEYVGKVLPDSYGDSYTKLALHARQYRNTYPGHDKWKKNNARMELIVHQTLKGLLSIPKVSEQVEVICKKI